MLENLTYRLAPNERYSHVFDGNAQEIDHVVVLRALQAGAQMDVLHVNRDEFASDHDPVLVQLTAGTPLITQSGPAAAETLTGNDGAISCPVLPATIACAASAATTSCSAVLATAWPTSPSSSPVSSR